MKDRFERTEEQGILIERILVLIRNVLQIPASPDAERRGDNDASLHDQALWSLHQSGLFDLILYIIGSEDEHQYHFHALEIICLMYREQVCCIHRLCTFIANMTTLIVRISFVNHAFCIFNVTLFIFL